MSAASFPAEGVARGAGAPKDSGSYCPWLMGG